MKHDRRVQRWAGCLFAFSVLVGCGGGGNGPGDTGTPPPDTGMDATTDGAPTRCTTDAECDDTRFCNGAETCDPSSPAADARGCVAGSDPCSAGEGCMEADDECVPEACSDMDGDGRTDVACGGDDCDDADGNRYPGNAEVCDPAGHDEDCDAATFGVRDQDGDGEPDAACCNTASDGSMNCGTDCDDIRGTVGPTRTEVCDGIDNDCDEGVDEGVLLTWYEDADGDGYGSSDPGAATMEACTKPTNYADTADDCNDAARGINPGQTELCDFDRRDEDCDGEANPDSLCTCSGDITRDCALPGACAAGTQRCVGGGWGACSIAPLAEVCNGEDDDCDGSTDETLTIVCYADGDDDGYAPMGTSPEDLCPTSGRGAVGGCPFRYTDRVPTGAAIDCDDTQNGVSPAAKEVCDTDRVDENCDGTGNPAALCECDGSASRACPQPGVCAGGNQTCVSGRWSACTIAPGIETCNGTDDDCDGTTDEGLRVTCYEDDDDDSYAASGATSSMVCPVSGRSAVGGCAFGSTNRSPATVADCDDTRDDVYPMATEECDMPMVDEDCDGMRNEDCTCSEGQGRNCPSPGVCSGGTQLCSAAGEWGLCSIQPGPEDCDFRDDDCDGVVDEGVNVECWTDDDDDGIAPSGATSSFECPVSGRAAVGGCPVGTTDLPPTAAVDCDDTRDDVYPTAPEQCDLAMTDEDCDTMRNEGCECAATESRTCVQPGLCSGGTQTCLANGTWGSCSILPSLETCDLKDNDCDGLTDETLLVRCWDDDDDDTFAAMGAASEDVCPVSGRGAVGGCPFGTTNRQPQGVSIDCDDSRDDVSPGDPEQCDMDMVDENCNGLMNEGCTCASGDMRSCPNPGACMLGTQTCTAMGTWGLCSIQPTTESCNVIDDDCDGRTDEGVNVQCWDDDDDDGVAAPGADSTFVCPVVGRDTVGGCPFQTTNRNPATTADCDDTTSNRSPLRSETCDAVDNDCDSLVDETFPCVQGTTGLACSPTSCGTAGTRSCQADCSFSACRAAEMCNGCDDDGANGADDTFMCVQGATNQVCTTACGTPGTGTCNGTCDGYTGCKMASDTVCNYCNDDLDAYLDDEAPAATATSGALPTCGTMVSALSLGCGPTASYTGLGEKDELVLLNTPLGCTSWCFLNNVATFSPGVRLGYGQMRAHVTMRVQNQSTASAPNYGWAMIFAQSGTIEFGTADDTLGYRRESVTKGLAIEWRFAGNGFDTVTVRRLNGTATGVVLGTPQAIDGGTGERTSMNLDTADTGVISQELTVRYTPELQYTSPTREEDLTVSHLPTDANAFIDLAPFNGVTGQLNGELSSGSSLQFGVSVSSTTRARFWMGVDCQPIINGCASDSDFSTFGMCP